MKHNLKITIILLSMFIIAQLIGLYAVNFYTSDGIKLPYGFNNQAPPEAERTVGFYSQLLISVIVSFAIAVLILIFLMRLQSLWFLRGWFFIVIALALGITINIITTKAGLSYPSLFALGFGIFLAYMKVFQKNVIIHNLTELLIYPGIAVIFVSMLNLWVTIILLLAISIYDIWAVWHSKVMQKMAKFQIKTLGIFGGFLVPYAPKEIREKIRLLKLKFKNHKIPEKVIKKHKIKIGLAILGGGDIVFPIIAAGVFFKTFGNIWASLTVTLFAALALLYLFVFAEKKKFYPAMPYITTGIFLGMLIGWLLFI